MSREELEKKAWKQFDVHSTLTKKVDILVCDDVDSGTEKVEKAKRYGTKIMNYYDFLELLDGGDRAQSKKELREYMAEKKLSDASKYRLKISKYGELKDLRSTATYLVIPDNVVEICEWAFSFDDSLLLVVIPSSVTTVGRRTFQNCKNLKSVVICDGVKRIGEGAFFACSSLASVTIPSSVERIFKLTFMNSGIKSVVIPENVWEIHSEAFYYCFSLTEITFRGTKSQWEKVSKGEKWNYCVPAKVVHCSDGDAELTGAAE